MALFTGRRRWLFLPLGALGFLLLFTHLRIGPRAASEILDHVTLPPIPGWTRPPAAPANAQYEPVDNHPVSLAIADADRRWLAYDANRSHTCAAAVSRYRREHGRHPPPGFAAWYKFAKGKNVYHVDDFSQAMGDLRPFWSVPPATLRNLAAHMGDIKDDGISTLHVRGHKVVKISNTHWRSETLARMLEGFIEHLPDMDIACNLFDQPRVAVPWEDLQVALTQETESRVLAPNAMDEFTANMSGLNDLSWEDKDKRDDHKEDKEEKKEEEKPLREDPGWFAAHGKQYMDIVKPACPPESHAVRNEDPAAAEAVWKSGGVVNNFNLSSDLCTVGPELQDKHGFLFTASTIVASKRLIPIFGECKVNVNNDILFPANKYWQHDERYDYDDWYDVKWHKKEESLIWRGVTSGGVQLSSNWDRLHRQRLVQMLNATHLAGRPVGILAEDPEVSGDYLPFARYDSTQLLRNRTDVGFTEAWGCIPANCSFYDTVFAMRPSIDLREHFGHKYLVDVDGHSFSGRWRAFMLSRALGIKATIFREWHDSRLFAWRHFAPMDNRFEDVYTLLTYFIGVGKLEDTRHGEAFVPRHDAEAKRLAEQGHEWAQKVLRREDIEVSTQRSRLATAFKFVTQQTDLKMLDIHVSTTTRIRTTH